jgi:hypothetical protein
MKGKGIQAAKLQIDWPELIRFKRSFTEPVPKRREDGRAQENDDAETARLFEETHAAALTYRTDYFLLGAATVSFYGDSRCCKRAPISQTASPRRGLWC